MKKILTVLVLMIFSYSVYAEGDSKTDFTIGADLVSSYVWRGALGAGTSLQPSMGIEIGNFSLSSWGSVDIASIGAKEVDFTASYTVSEFSLSVTDYWWVGEGVEKYYMYESRRTGHVFEAILAYTLPIEKFPLNLSWSTMFAGADYFRRDNEKRAYSTYIEFGYPVPIKDITLNSSLGLTPWESMYASDFSVVNIALKATKTIKVTDSFSFPVFGQIITNPKREDMFFVVGLSL